jgi:hypothetical protein
VLANKDKKYHEEENKLILNYVFKVPFESCKSLYDYRSISQMKLKQNGDLKGYDLMLPILQMEKLLVMTCRRD